MLASRRSLWLYGIPVLNLLYDVAGDLTEHNGTLTHTHDANATLRAARASPRPVCLAGDATPPSVNELRDIMTLFGLVSALMLSVVTQATPQRREPSRVVGLISSHRREPWPFDATPLLALWHAL